MESRIQRILGGTAMRRARALMAWISAAYIATLLAVVAVAIFYPSFYKEHVNKPPPDALAFVLNLPDLLVLLPFAVLALPFAVLAAPHSTDARLALYLQGLVALCWAPIIYFIWYVKTGRKGAAQ
jgi:hypothetical protein